MMRFGYATSQPQVYLGVLDNSTFDTWQFLGHPRHLRTLAVLHTTQETSISFPRTTVRIVYMVQHVTYQDGIGAPPEK